MTPHVLVEGGPIDGAADRGRGSLQGGFAGSGQLQGALRAQGVGGGERIERFLDQQPIPLADCQAFEPIGGGIPAQVKPLSVKIEAFTADDHRHILGADSLAVGVGVVSGGQLVEFSIEVGVVEGGGEFGLIEVQ